MIAFEEIFKIGYISKKRGLRGEVEMIFTDDAFDTGDSEYLVLDMDGIPVPFFWEEYRFKRDDTVILKIEDIDDEDAAGRLVGKSVYYPKALVAASSDEEEAVLSSYKALTGYEVTDSEGQPLGTIIAVDDSSANVLLAIERPDGEELIVPYHDDFLLHFSARERRMALDIPHGILTLNEEE